MEIGILYRKELTEYDFGEGHPFRGDRYELFYNFLRENLAADKNYQLLQADQAGTDDLLLICNKNYIEFTRGYYDAANVGLSYPGRFADFQSMDNIPTAKPGRLEEAARFVVGQAKMACNLIQEGKFQKVVSVGGGLHHAKPNYGEGFCLYNDVAFCAKYLLHVWNLNRIMILDTDAHAGNGTSEYFYDNPNVLFIDIHQDPQTIYPGTGFIDQIGADSGEGFTVNITMPVQSGNESYKLVFESIVEPLTLEFKPQIIIRNGGSDPHFDDGLTNLGLSLDGFYMIGEKLRRLSDVCNGRVIDLIASGYNQNVLPHAWLALISGLAGFDVNIVEPNPLPSAISPDSSLTETMSMLEKLKNNLKNYWTCFK